MDSLSTPRNITSFDGSCYEAIDSSFSQNICSYLEIFSMQYRTLQLKIPKKTMNKANFINIYIFIGTS